MVLASAVVGALLLMLVAYVGASLAAPVCQDDCFGYIVLMHMKGHDFSRTLASMAWPWAIPTVKPWAGVMLRPWSVPAFFALFGAFTPLSALEIVLAQTALAFASWLAFAACCASFFQGRPMRIAVFFAIAAMMFGQGYLHNNHYVLSDSLALSSVLIQLSLCLLFPRAAAWRSERPGRWPWLAAYIAAIVFASAVEMGTRDANISLALAAAALPLLAPGRRPWTPRLVALALVGALAVPASVSAKLRHEWNSENILIAVVLPSPDIRGFFVDHGMPPEVERTAEGLRQQDLAHVDNVEMDRLRAERDTVLAPFLSKADRLYAEYLALHPTYVAEIAGRYWNMIFNQQWLTDNFAPRSPTPRLSPADWLPVWLYPIFPVLYLSRRNLRRQIGYWPPLLFAIGAGNALLGFFGDVWTPSEMARHAFIGAVVMRIGVMACLLFTAESVCSLLLANRPISLHRDRGDSLASVQTDR